MQMKRITRISEKQPLWATTLLLAVFLPLLTGCGLQKDIDVELPAYPAQLVVEFYLMPGQVPQLTVTETTEYLASPTPAVPLDVRVVLTEPGGLTDTIPFAPSYDSLMQKAYTHRGTKPVQARPGDTFTLDITDSKGRHVTGTATMPALVPIDTVEWKFNDKPDDQRRAYVLLRFHDPATPGDYYRFQVHRSKISRDPEVDYTPEDRLNNGQEFTLGTSYEFEPNDTLVVSLFHLDRPYYQFQQSVQDARSANGNPFGQPAAIRSTVQGGVGVFTVLSYQRRTIIVK
jgi:hypothetical protein